MKTIGSQAYSILDSAQGWRSFKVLSKWYSAEALETSTGFFLTFSKKLKLEKTAKKIPRFLGQNSMNR